MLCPHNASMPILKYFTLAQLQYILLMKWHKLESPPSGPSIKSACFLLSENLLDVNH